MSHQVGQRFCQAAFHVRIRSVDPQSAEENHEKTAMDPGNVPKDPGNVPKDPGNVPKDQGMSLRIQVMSLRIQVMSLRIQVWDTKKRLYHS